LTIDKKFYIIYTYFCNVLAILPSYLMSIDNEKLILFKASRGDSEAYGELFDKYSKPIYRFIYFKVATQEIAEDLTSQAFLKVWEYILEGKKIKQFKPFIYRTARNLVIDYYRTREKEELPLIYLSEEIEEQLKVDPDKEIDKENLEKLISTLKSDQREVIVLRYIEGLSIKEISNVVDKSNSNVRVIIHRALKELKKFT